MHCTVDIPSEGALVHILSESLDVFQSHTFILNYRHSFDIWLHHSSCDILFVQNSMRELPQQAQHYMLLVVFDGIFAKA